MSNWINIEDYEISPDEEEVSFFVYHNQYGSVYAVLDYAKIREIYEKIGGEE